MCVACGLPTTHSNFVQTLGMLSIISFGVTTFIGAWWVLTAANIKNKLLAFRSKKGTVKQTASNQADLTKKDR